MKKIFILSLTCLYFCMPLSAQKYFTRTGTISFSSEAPMEKIEAVNNNATAVIDAETGKMEFAVLIKAFQFEKALMQEHFNENYMESSKFPKSKFKGKISNILEVDFSKDGTYEVQVEGQLTIHGETNKVSSSGTIAVKDGLLSAKSSFEVAVADYGIVIPAIVRENIAKTVTIAVAIDDFQLLNQ